MCGKDLYATLRIKELREKKSKHVEFYQVTVDGIEDEVCSKCYEYLKDRKGANE
jgi:hypothetical protein